MRMPMAVRRCQGRWAVCLLQKTIAEWICVLLLMGFNVGEGETRRLMDEMIVEDTSICVVAFQVGVEDGDGGLMMSWSGRKVLFCSMFPEVRSGLVIVDCCCKGMVVQY